MDWNRVERRLETDEGQDQREMVRYSPTTNSTPSIRWRDQLGRQDPGAVRHRQGPGQKGCRRLVQDTALSGVKLAAAPLPPLAFAMPIWGRRGPGQSDASNKRDGAAPPPSPVYSPGF